MFMLNLLLWAPVAILHRKLESIGAQKGILISTSNFQSGAVEYGKAHGITLIKAEDYHFEYLSHSSGQHQNDDNDPFLYAEQRLSCRYLQECKERRGLYGNGRGICNG